MPATIGAKVCGIALAMPARCPVRPGTNRAGPSRARSAPAGVPVATVAVGNARNAGLLAVRILAATDPGLRARMVDFQAGLRDTAHAKGEVVRREAGSASSQRLGF